MRRSAWILVAFAACGFGSASCSSSGNGSATGYSAAGASAGGADAGSDASGTGGTSGGAGSATGGSGGTTGGAGGTTGGTGGTTGGTGGTTGGAGGTSGGAGGVTGGSGGAATGGSAGSGGANCSGGCPTGYTCGTANGKAVCRAQSGIPLFSHVFIILMENTSLSTLQSAMSGGNAPNLAKLAKNYATGSDYHGVAHPSLPNYIALTSGDTQGIGCDCSPSSGSTCSALNCNRLLSSCKCDQNVKNLADQLEAAKVSWKAFGEDMGTACNLTDSGKYAVRHVPFLYYDDIQTNSARCKAHVVDYSNFSPGSAPRFTYIAPNLTDDMHDPAIGAGIQNIKNGDAWIGPATNAILASSAYKQGGLLVVVWDEDDLSGGVLGTTDDPIPIFLASPYAKHSGYVSKPKADHYSLLATIEDGLGLPRLGKAATKRSGVAETLSDYFPAK